MSISLEDIANLLSAGLSAQMTEESGYLTPIDDACLVLEYEGHIDLMAMAAYIAPRLPQPQGQPAPDQLGTVDLDETGSLRITISPQALQQIG